MVSVRCSMASCDCVFYVARIRKEAGETFRCSKHIDDLEADAGDSTDPQPSLLSDNMDIVPSHLSRPQRDGTIVVNGFDTAGLTCQIGETHYDCTSSLIGDGDVDSYVRVFTLVAPERRTALNPLINETISSSVTAKLLALFERINDQSSLSTRNIAYGIAVKMPGGSVQTLLLPIRVCITGRPDEIIVAVLIKLSNNNRGKFPIIYRTDRSTLSVPMSAQGKKEKAFSTYMADLCKAASSVEGAKLSNHIDDDTALRCCKELEELFPATSTLKLQNQVASLTQENRRLKADADLERKASSNLVKVQQELAKAIAENEKLSKKHQQALEGKKNWR
jgi:hypothetical protein